MTIESIFKNSIYFDSSEFASPDLPMSGLKMNPIFMLKLIAARSISNEPFIINSGFRTPEHNKKIGGISSSSHLIGRACDIKIINSRQRFQIIHALLCCGINRIGIYKNYIHIDYDLTKPNNVIWKG